MFTRYQVNKILLSAVVLSYFFVSSAPAEAQTITGFQMPSKNIACLVFDHVLRCDINNNLAKIPPQPKSCDLDWGFAFTMGEKSKPQYLCAGDTALDNRLPILAYGKTWKSQGFTCQSSKAGLRCFNQSKKGWFLNRLQQQFF